MKDEYCFGTNRVYKLCGETGWRPTHYLAVTNENWRYKAWAKSLNKMVETGIPCFLADKYWIYHEIGVTPDWYEPPEGNNVFQIRARKFIHGKPEEINTKPGWARDIENIIVSHRTVSMVWLQLAHWMGFSPLYFVGCDLGYKPHSFDEPDPNHFWDSYENTRSKYRAENDNLRMQIVHDTMSGIAKREGIEVYNATIGGELESYERVDIYDILR
jgi:hypothetical protein